MPTRRSLFAAALGAGAAATLTNVPAPSRAAEPEPEVELECLADLVASGEVTRADFMVG